MSERDDRVTVVETKGGGGDAVFVGMFITSLVLLGLFFLFGDQIYSGGAKNIDVDVNLPKVEAPAKH
jgi:hypothetical protein